MSSFVQHLQELLRQPYIQELVGDITAKQRVSLQRLEELRPLSATSPAFWPYLAPPMPICAESAHGSRVTDADGNEYLDCHMGWGAQALHGHNPEPVVAAVRDALSRNTGNGYFNSIELKLVKLLAELMPHCEKFSLLNSGTDATQAAIRLCRAKTGRTLVAKVEGSLHGVHELGAHNTAFWYHGNPMMVPFPERTADGIVPTPATRGVPASRDLLVLPHNDSEAFELIERHRDELACVIAEPTCSAFPFEDVSIPFAKQLSETCGSLGIPFILDEVLTGFRMGISGAGGMHGIKADLYAYGKVISGLGLPLSAVGGRADILDLAQTGGSALSDIGNKALIHTTHMGNCLSLCASYASLELLKSKGDAYYVETRNKVNRLRAKVDALREREGIPLQLMGFGDFIGIFGFLAQRPKSLREFAGSVNPLGYFVLPLMLRRRGVYMFSMPLLFTGGAHSVDDLDQLFSKVEDSLLEMKSNSFPFVLS